MAVSERCIKVTRFFFTPGERSDTLLCNQLQQADEAIAALVTRDLFDFQRDALTCLLSDIIGGYAASFHKFPDSILLRALNKGMYQIAAAEFSSFCLVEGKPDTKAWQKRRFEQLLFARGIMIFS